MSSEKIAEGGIDQNEGSVLSDPLIEKAAIAMWLEEAREYPNLYAARLQEIFAEQISAPKWRMFARAAAKALRAGE